MEDVLITELLFPKGHKSLNETYVSLISENYRVTLIDDGEYFSSVDDSVLKKRVILQHFNVARIEKMKTVLYASFLRKVAKTAKKLGIKNVVLLSFHTEAYALVKSHFKGMNVCVVHHYDIDRMAKRNKEEKAFAKYKNTITHCVLEDFIAEGIIEKYDIDPSRVYVVRIPVEEEPISNNTTQQNVFIGIGQSIDEGLIDEIIAYDKVGRFSETRRGKMILRSKRMVYQSDAVEVFKGYLDKKEYDEIFSSSTACIVKYDSSYSLRASGNLIDAFKNHKKAIVTGFPAGENYAKIYPKNCIHVNSTEEIIDLLIGDVLTYDQVEGERFILEHSHNTVKKQWDYAIRGVSRSH